MPESPDSSPRSQSQHFFINVLWNWLSVGTNLFTGLFLTPYIIRKLGDKRYGIWALVFSLIEYVFLFDLGFKSAIVNFISRFRVQDDSEGINEVINTALVYFAIVAGVIVTLTATLAGQGYRFFQIAPEDRADFAFLLALIGFTWAAGIVSNIFQACLEAFQQFKIYNHISIVMMMLRAGGSAALLFAGHGLRALGMIVVAAQFLGYILMFTAFHRLFARLSFSRRYIRMDRWKQMARFGVNSVIASSGTLFLNQGPPLVVGHYLTSAFVGYYTFPSRLLNYAVEMIARIGFVTAPKTAELMELGNTGKIVKLGTYINRYCFALFMPVSIYLGVYGTALLNRWIGPAFAHNSGPLLPIFAVSVSIAIAGQFNSSCILFGIARHGSYAISIVIESLIALAGMAFVLPRYGIFGAALIAASLAVINRGFITPWLMCHHLRYSYLRYMYGIYGRPLCIALPLLGLAFWLKFSWLAGRTWFELIAGAAIICSIGLLLGLFTCVESEHRDMFRDTLLDRLRPRRQQAAV